MTCYWKFTRKKIQHKKIQKLKQDLLLISASITLQEKRNTVIYM